MAGEILLYLVLPGLATFTGGLLWIRSCGAPGLGRKLTVTWLQQIGLLALLLIVIIGSIRSSHHGYNDPSGLSGLNGIGWAMAWMAAAFATAINGISALIIYFTRQDMATSD